MVPLEIFKTETLKIRIETFIYTVQVIIQDSCHRKKNITMASVNECNVVTEQPRFNELERERVEDKTKCCSFRQCYAGSGANEDYGTIIAECCYCSFCKHCRVSDPNCCDCGCNCGDCNICDCDTGGCDACGCDASGCDAGGCDAGGCDAGGCDADGCGAGGCDAGGCDAGGCGSC